MTDKSNRVSGQKLADVIAAAVELETKRIEQMSAEQVDAVAGGFVSSGVSPIGPGGPTMGFFPTQTPPTV